MLLFSNGSWLKIVGEWGPILKTPTRNSEEPIFIGYSSGIIRVTVDIYQSPPIKEPPMLF
jgi:hypothetical protein